MASFLKFRLKRPLDYAGLILLVLSILSSPFTLTWFINTPYVKERLSAYVLKKAGADLPPETFSFILFPQAALNIKDIALHPSDKIDLFVESLTFNMDLMPLLHGSLNIKQVKMDHPAVTFKSPEKASFKPSADGLVSNAVAGLKTIFDFLPESQDAIELTIKNGSHPNIKQIDGSIYLSKKNRQIHLNTTLSGIGFSPSDLVNDPVSFNKALDLNFIKLDQIKLSVMLDSTGDIQGNCRFISPELTSSDHTVLFDVPLIESVFNRSDEVFQMDINPFVLTRPKASLAVHFSNDPQQFQSYKSTKQRRGYQYHPLP